MKLGEYELGPNDTEEAGIYHGDMREWASTIPDNTVDVIFLDPPFFLPAQHYKTRKRWSRSVADLSVIESFFSDIFIACARIIKSSGILVVFCDGQSYPVMYIKLYRLFNRLVDVVWDKGQIGMGNGIRRQHELLILGINGSEFPGWESSVIQCPPVKAMDKIHPAQKPVALYRRILHALVHPGAVVADFMCGSGSSLVAAYEQGMYYLGLDLEMGYVKSARRRIKTAQPPLFVPPKKIMQVDSFRKLGAKKL